MLAAHNACLDRANALSNLASLQSRAEKLKFASSRVFSSDKTKNRKAEELIGTIKITKDSKNCAVREYEQIKVRNQPKLWSMLKLHIYINNFHN